ncbi:MAG: hypothetical protein QOG40_850 [Solirubrobacteraceae bacterium]|nr:hypothetical protein [Solirubrobacteraceae bacterium]
MRPANVLTDDFEYDETDPEGYRCGVAQVGKAAGGEDLAIKSFELPPGESVCPYHYEYAEEWLLVLEGDVVVRTPEGEQELHRGDLVRFAPGPGGAHKATNGGQSTARIVMFSSAREPAVAVYPDSDKIGVWPGDKRDNLMVPRDAIVDYWTGET